MTGSRAWWALAVLVVPCVVVVMDLTVLFLAMPSIVPDVGASATAALWITDVYGFLIAASLLTMGNLADRLGRRRALIGGAAVFAVASAAAALAPSAGLLIVARAVQGTAAGRPDSVHRRAYRLGGRQRGRHRRYRGGGAAVVAAASAGGGPSSHYPHRIRAGVLGRCRTRHTYILKGLVRCGVCGRRMQGQYNHDAAYYRCRYPQEYALANTIEHPRNVYLREDCIIDPLDTWLAAAFDPPQRQTTITAMYQAQAPDEAGVQTDPTGLLAAKIAECDQRLERYKTLFDAGAHPDVVAGWITTTQAERAHAQAQLVPRQRRASGQRMSRAEIEDLVGRLGEIVATLRNADPRDKAEVYQHLGLSLRLDPGRNLVRAEARIGSTGGDMVRVGGGT